MAKYQHIVIDTKPIGVIYKITNSINGKIYIGQTVRSLPLRLKDYYWESLKKKPSQVITMAMKKYGFENFLSEIICECFTQANLDLKERYYIKTLNTIKEGYNVDAGGVRYPRTLEIGRKISKAKKGKKFSEDHKAKLSAARKGKEPWNKGITGVFTHSVETKKKIGKASKGHKYNLGKKRSLQYRLNKREEMKLVWSKREDAQSDMWAEIIQLYVGGMLASELSRQFDLDPRTIIKRLKKKLIFRGPQK